MKAFLQYAALVGIPILSVLIFIRIGENTLNAPASIGGAWDLEPVFASDAGIECPDLVFEGEPVLSISQSGIYLEIEFNDRDNTTLSGMLTDLTVNAQKSTASSTISLDAAIDRQPDPDRLEGMLSVSSCAEPFSILASRRSEINLLSEGH